jgi:hypothetical protein
MNIASAIDAARGPLPTAIMAVPERRERVVALVDELSRQGLSPVVVWDHEHRGPWWSNLACWDLVTQACGEGQWGLVLEDDIKLGANFVSRALTLLASLDGTEPVTFYSKHACAARSIDGVRQRKPFVRMRGRDFTGTLAMAMMRTVALDGLAWIRATQGTPQEPAHWLHHGDERWRSYFGGKHFVVSTPSLVNHDDGGVSIANPHWNGHPRPSARWFEG